ncbi:MAG: Tat pathway signal protein [Gemmatimonadota bacterium]|nr:Tat pathway signal protein [Gemmatimonadota bacterium]MDH5282657.1 Tat pathway signal protein [Gemmatimonadota bacterium]
MRRRDFLGALASAGALAGVRPHASGPAARHWAWVHGGSQRTVDEWRRRFVRLRGAGIGGVHVGGGDLELLSNAAREEGLTFSRWIWVLNRNGDSWVKANHPEWFTVSRRGESSLEKPPYVGYYNWLCPTRPEVREYLSREVADLAMNPAVDEVHLDYVRHCDVILPVGLWEKYGLVQDHELPEFDFCYCDVCRAAFRQQSGVDPRELPDPESDLAWRKFRWDGVTGLVKELARGVKGAGKPITAAVFPTPALARKLVRQAWDEWPLDAAFPMTYHAFYKEGIPWIGEAIREGVAAVPVSVPIFAGLYLPDLAPADLGRAVRAALDAGAAGVSLFEMDGLTDAHLAALGSAGG